MSSSNLPEYASRLDKSVVRDTPSTEIALNYLNGAVSDLEMAVEQLSKKLTAVIIDDPDKVGVGVPKMITPTGDSQLARAILVQASKVTDMVTQLKSINNCVDL